MAKITIVGDIHLRSVEKFGKFNTETGLNTRTEDKLRMIEEVVDTSITAEVDLVVFLGDIFDVVNPSERLRSFFVEKLRPLFDAKITTIVILGNHEIGGFDLHSFLTAKALNLDYFRICNELKEISLGGKSILLVPYGYEKALYNKLLEKNYDLMLSHIPISPQWENGIEGSFLKEHIRIIRNGHYHTADEFHVGSLCVYNRKEIGVKHRYEILDLNKEHFVAIDVEDREFLKIDTDVEYFTEHIKKYKDFKGIVSIKIIDIRENLESISTVSVRNLFSNAFKVTVDKKCVISNAIESPVVQNFNMCSVEEDIKDWCKKSKREEMIDIGLEIYNEAIKS